MFWCHKFCRRRRRDQAKLVELYMILCDTLRKLDYALGAPRRRFFGNHKEAGMSVLDDALDAAKASSSRTDSIILLVDDLKKQVADALSGVTLPPAVEAKISEILTIEKGDAEKIDVALNANAPPPVV